MPRHLVMGGRIQQFFPVKTYALIICGLILIFSGSAAFAGGPVHGSRAGGMGSAFTAVADDPSAIVHNPAGLTQVKGTQIYGGPTFVVISSKYESPSGEKEETDFQVFYPPHLFISSDFGKENITAGIGIYAPFGIGGRKWDSNGLTRFASVESFIATLSVSPVIAVEILPGLSIAGGAEYMRAINEASKKVDQSMFGAGDATLEIEAEGDGWGYRFGVLYKPNDKLSFGVDYRSEIKVDQEGELKLQNVAPALQPLFGGAEFKTDVKSTTDFPEALDLGIAYRPTPKLILAFDAEWVGWSSFDRSDLDLDTEVPAAGFSDSSTPLDWDDSWIVKIGIEYGINDMYSIRGGYVYMEQSVPDHTLEPGNPDSDQHNFSIGFGYRKDKWTADFFYNAGFFEDRQVDNAILSGEYETVIHFTGMSTGYRF